MKHLQNNCPGIDPAGAPMIPTEAGANCPGRAAKGCPGMAASCPGRS